MRVATAVSTRCARRAGTAVGLLLLAATLSACTEGGIRVSATATDGVVEVIAAEDRQEVDQITGKLLDGGAFDSASLKGRVVVYNVWGSWCAPCRTEAPELKRVWQETQTLGVQFVGVNVRDNDASARAFEDNYGIDYPSITTETSSEAILAFGSALPPSAVPSTMIVDARGRLAARIVGPVDYSTLSTLVTEAAAESEAQPS